MRQYLIKCIEANDDCMKYGYEKNNQFIEDVVEEYEENLQYVDDEYSEVDAKNDAIQTVFFRWHEMNTIF